MAVETLAQSIEEFGDLVLSGGDVPMALRHGSRHLPLGRYLRDRLRKEFGFEKEVYLQRYLETVRETEMSFMQEAYEKGGAKEYQKALIDRIETRKQNVLNIETKFKILNSEKGSL